MSIQDIFADKLALQTTLLGTAGFSHRRGGLCKLSQPASGGQAVVIRASLLHKVWVSSLRPALHP